MIIKIIVWLLKYLDGYWVCILKKSSNKENNYVVGREGVCCVI